MSILVVEDNAISAKIIEVNLKKAGYDPVIVNAGAEALNRLSDPTGIQMVITDAMMPGVDGFELMRKMKENPALKEIPVVMCSSLGGIEYVKKAILLGCKHYLVKPVQPALLLQKVSEVLTGERPVLRDRYEVMVRFGLDEVSYREVRQSFARLVDEQIVLLAPAVERRRSDRLPVAVVSLMEAATVLGAQRLLDTLEAGLGGKDESAASLKGYLVLYRELLEELKTVAAALVVRPSN